MRRAARINRDWWHWWRAQRAAVPGLALGGIFVGLSGWVSVTSWYETGEASGNGLILAVAAIAAEGITDLSVPMYWRRVGIVGRVLLLALFAVSLGYKLEAAKRFSAEKLGARDAVVAKAAENYDLARERVEGLRRTVATNADARSATLIQSEIDELLRDPKAEGCLPGQAWNGSVTQKVCPRVDKLRAELARAKERDQAQADLKGAIEDWRNATPVVAKAVTESVGPVALLLALIGISVTSWSALMSTLFMTLVEAGAIIVPMLNGAASRAGEKLPQTGAPAAPAPAQIAEPPAPTSGATNPPAPPAPVPPGVTDRTRRDILELRAFLLDQVEPAQGERVQSSSLYLIYTTWKKDASRRGYKPGEEPMTIVQFGKLLSKPIGLKKAKCEGRQYYLNIRLRHPAQGRKGVGQARSVAA